MRRDSPDTNSHRSCAVFGDSIYRSHESWEHICSFRAHLPQINSSHHSNCELYLMWASITRPLSVFSQTTDTLEYHSHARASSANFIVIYPFGSIPFTFHVLDACLGIESAIFVLNIVGLFYLPLFDFRVEVKSRRTHFISNRKYLAFSSRDKFTNATHTVACRHIRNGRTGLPSTLIQICKMRARCTLCELQWKLLYLSGHCTFERWSPMEDK